MRVNLKDSIIGFIGGFIAISLLVFFAKYSGNLWIAAPFGASCVLVFGLWNAPLSQPRNVIGGHLSKSRNYPTFWI